MTSPFDNAYWDDEEGELWSALVGLFVDAIMDATKGALALLPPGLSVLVDFDLVNQQALAYAKRYRYELIKGITDTTRKQVQELMSDWILSGESLSTLEAKLAPIFGNIRAQMIAATEITRIFQESNVMAWATTGYIDQVEFRTVVDDRVCPICSPLDGQILPLNDKTNHPPRHVRCRCFTLPVVSEEKVLSQIDTILKR